MAYLTVENLSFAYPAQQEACLHSVDFSVEQGEFVVLWGRSGSGKTTLLRHLKPVLVPHGRRGGRILLNGEPYEQELTIGQGIQTGYVMQDPDHQIVTDSVSHELIFGLENIGLDSDVIRLRVAETVNRFNLGRLLHKTTASLSGGEKQLLNLAAVLAMNPRLLVLDEPTAQLDPVTASLFLDAVEKANRELGITVILSEQRLEEVLHRATRLLVLKEGRLIADGSPRTVLYQMNAIDEEQYLLEAVPAPVKVWRAVDGVSSCPLTVREGKQWLMQNFQKQGPSIFGEQEKVLKVKQRAPMAVIAKELWFRYEKNAPDIFKGLHLSVPKGSFLALMGGNGAGKSTLLKAICGLVRSYRGNLKVDSNAGGKYAGAALVPQNPKVIFCKKTVRQDLLDALKDRNMTEPQKHIKILDVAKKTYIEPYLDQHPHDLSGGQQQFAAIAKALLREPALLLLDEITKGVDRDAQNSLGELLKSLTKDGVTVIIASHDIEFCARYADFCALLFDGIIVAAGNTKKVLSDNQFFTTAASRMARDVFPRAVTSQEVIALCRQIAAVC